MPLFALGGACSDPGWPGSHCPANECVFNEVACSSDTILRCELYDGDPCSYTTWNIQARCNPTTHQCMTRSPTEAACVAKDDFCPEDAVSVCRGSQLHDCFLGRVAGFVDCAGASQVCLTVTSAGVQRGLCALDDSACRNTGEAHECRGNELLTCDGGHPINSRDCEVEGEQCVELTPATAECL